MAITLKFNDKSMQSGLSNFSRKCGAVILMYSANYASQMKAYMKVNRPWTDRTGRAKSSLDAKVSQPNSTTVRITCSHGVDYGIWLELAHGKRFAIVAPTIRAFAPKMIRGLHTIFGEMGGGTK